MNRTWHEALAWIAVGFASAVLLYTATTNDCLTRTGYVWDVDYRTCAPRNAYVPAGYVPAPTPRVPNGGAK